MDRERKLLYTVAVLAPILEVMTVAAYCYQPDLSKQAAALEETRTCEKQLVRAWAQCAPRHFRDTGI